VPLHPSFKKFTLLSGKAFVLPSKLPLIGNCRALRPLCSASSNNQLCVTQTLSNVEAVNGALTTSKLSGILSAVAGGNFSSLTGVNLCTPCDKQIYNTAKNDFPAIFGQGAIATDVQSACGASFVGKSAIFIRECTLAGLTKPYPSRLTDGASDPNIVQTASNQTTSGITKANTDSAVQITGQQALLSAFLLGLLALAA
jgi:hypothetical protein